jgi:hypothetical protein
MSHLRQFVELNPKNKRLYVLFMLNTEITE